jgi:hypothetical protein
MDLPSLFKHIQKIVRNNSLHSLQKGAVLGLAILFGFTLSTSNLPEMLNDGFRSMLSAVLPSVVVELTNDERTDEDLTILTRSTLLDEAALLKAEHMRDNNYFAHDSPEGIEPWYWFNEVGYDYIHAGENLAVFFDDSEDVVKAWMDSPLHRDNILKDEYTEIGVATVEAEHKGYSTVFIVQLFGTPADNTVSVLAQNEADDTENPTEIVVPETRAVIEKTETTNDTQTEDIQKETPVAPLEKESETETTVSSVAKDDTTVFVSNHVATSTIETPAVTSIENSVTSQRDTSSFLDILYLFVALMVTGVIAVSIAHSAKDMRYAQVVYGFGLLLATMLTISAHAYVVGAIQLF